MPRRGALYRPFGRPGPVVVDLTKTAQTGEMYYSWPQRMILPGYNPTTRRTAA